MERRRLATDTFALVPPALEERGFLAVFTERTGGRSGAPFDTLNLGLKTGDARAAVLANRKALVASVGLERWAMPTQVHGARITTVGGDPAAGFADPATTLGPADGVEVEDPGVAVAIITADCLPIVLASPAEGRFLVVHAGWRGLAAGILAEAVGRFERPAEVWAAIGPAIGVDHYEVGDEVAAAVGAGAAGGAVTQRREGRPHLDLEATAANALRAAGVRRVEASGVCTACHPGRFFSHRRDGETGRQALVAVRL